MSKNKIIFSYRLVEQGDLSSAHSVFCTVSGEFSHRPVNVSIRFAGVVVRACCVLRNFVHEKDGCNFDHALYVEILLDIPKSVP